MNRSREWRKIFKIIVPEAAGSEEPIQLVPTGIGEITALLGVTPMSPNEMEGPAVGNEASLSVAQVIQAEDVAAA